MTLFMADYTSHQRSRVGIGCNPALQHHLGFLGPAHISESRGQVQKRYLRLRPLLERTGKIILYPAVDPPKVPRTIDW